MGTFNSREQLKKDKISLIFVATGLLALIIFFAVVFPKDHKDKTPVGLSDERLKHTEERLLGQMHAVEERLGHLEERDQSFKQMMDRLDGLHAKVERMEQAVEAFQKKASQAPDVPRTSRSLRYHEVRTGDTLYQISRTYGLTVEYLRRMNNLAPDAAIQPGQKLIVK